MKPATFLFLSCLFLSSLGTQAQVEYVDPTIGGVGVLLEPTRPTVSLPNSMVRMYPMRADQLSDQINSFPLSTISHRLGELFWMKPFDVANDEATWSAPSTFDQDHTMPYYYSTRFDDSLIQTEFTPTARAGYFRFTFPSGKPGVLFANRQGGTMTPQGDRVLTGQEDFKDMSAYMYGEFNVPATFKPETVNDKGGYAVTAGPGQKTLEFRYGISYISIDQAKKNLEEEIPHPGFEAIKAKAKARWNEALGKIEVTGGTDTQKTIFYTALYRSYERMVNITEDGHYYSAWDHTEHADKRPFYVDCWIWDMFRSLEPLQILLNPDMVSDEIQSYVRMYQQSGWMPRFAVLFGTHPCMNGNHAAPWFADAWFKGVQNFDETTAFEGVRKNSIEGTHIPWAVGPKTTLDDFYNQNGYFPALDRGQPETEPRVTGEKRQPVPVTLENSYDDWAIAQLARVAKKPDDYDLFLKRSGNYKNVFNADTGFFWPKDAAGNWIEPLNPKLDGERDFYDENNAYTYNWDVIHDYAGLFTLLGGRDKAEARLDNLFRESLGAGKSAFFYKLPDSTGMVGQFSMGNEPSFDIPYLYNRLGAPWKTQKRIRSVLAAYFTDTLFGIPGDEDGGAMSSYVVWGLMGIYPVTPGVPVYDIGSPVFDTVAIHQPNGKTFHIIAHNTSKDNKYVQSITLNGKPLHRVWIRHADLVKGGTLVLEMGDTPNTTLGTDPADFPPDSMSVNPADFSTATP